MSTFTDISTWTERLGHSRLRTFTDEHNRVWVEQNDSKKSRWAELSHQGHTIAWEFESPGGAYTGRLLIDGEVYTTAEATRKFLRR